MIPDRPPAAALSRLTALLDRAAFTEPGVCEKLGIPDMYAFDHAGPGGREEPGDLLDLLVVLFLDAVAIDETLLQDWIPEEDRAALDRLGLLAHLDDGRCHATVVLYPTGPLRLVSDSPVDPVTGSLRVLEPDAVYPAVTDAARDFVAALPPSPRGRFLELCSGTGIGALRAARTADHAWAVDITARSTRFASFNAALNGLDNVTVLEGDLYAPLGGLRFDTVVAHPPYMQSEEIRDIYRDGGADGEQVTRRILEGLAAHLAPGGRFHCTCILTSREGVELEDRLRGMLGPTAGEFDLVLMPMTTLDPRQALFDEAVLGRTSLEQIRRRESIYRELGVRELVYCSMALQRKAAHGPARTLRRPRGAETTGADIEWFLDWELDPETRLAPDALAEAAASVPARVDARSDLALESGAWHPVDIALRTSRPFPASVRCAPWMLELLARCDGERSIAEVLDSLRRDGLLSPEAPHEGLLTMVRSLVSAGLLTLPSHPLPSDEPPPTRP